MGMIDKLVFLVEAFPEQAETTYGSGGKLEVRRVFPFRGGAEKKNAVAYAKYGLQNLKLLRVPTIAKQMNADVVVIHSWYFIHPSVIQHVIKKLKNQGVKLVADMRDVALKPEQFNRLIQFDALIGCGLRVIDHFRQDSRLARKLHHIPVPIEEVEITQARITETLKECDVAADRYIFSPSGVFDSKRFALVFDAWQLLLEEGERYDLVVAGRNRDWNERYGRKHVNGRLILTGALEKEAIHSLYAAAALSLNPSKFEGMPRTPVEAVGHGKPLLFPPATPEFSEFPEEFVCNTDSPAELAQQMKNAIKPGTLGVEYDISRHAPQNVARATFEMFRNLIER